MVVTGVQVNGENVIKVFGSEEKITVPTPWVPKGHESASLIVKRNDELEEREIIVSFEANQ